MARTNGQRARRVRVRRGAVVCLLWLLALPRGGWAQTDAIREEVKKAPAPQLTKAPKLTKFFQAPYPEDAQREGVQGSVALELTIDAGGHVVSVTTVASPDQRLTDAAEKAVRKFEFSPAEIDGKPAPVKLRYIYNFRLEATLDPLLPEWMLDQPVSKTTDAVVGQVREQGTRLPVSGAAVAIAVLGIEVRTDGRGRFAIPKVPPGAYRAEAFASTHKRSIVDIEVKQGQQTQIKFYLEPLKNDPYVTVVRGKRRQTTVSRVTLRKRQLTTVPGTFGDPIRVIQNLPGVARTPYVGGALLIRGAAPNDSGTYLDGIRIPILFHLLGGPSVINPEFLDRIDYYPGNSDARYNRLTGGVVDVGTSDTFTKQLKGSVDVNLLNAAAFVDVPVTDDISVAAAVRRSYIDALLPSILDAAGETSTTVVPVYYDYQTRLDMRLQRDDKLSLLVFGSDDRLEIASNEPDSDVALDFNSHTLFHRALATWRANFAGKRGISVLAPYLGYNLVRFDTGDAFIDIKSWIAGAREDVEYRVRRGVRLRAGVDVLFQYAMFSADIPLPTPYRNPGSSSGSGAGFGSDITDETAKIDVKLPLGSMGLYVDGIIDVTPKLQIIPGLRFDLFYYQDDNVRPTVDPRITARYRLGEKLVLKGGVGLYTQAPSPQVSNHIIGNPNLVLEHAVQASLGFERELFKPEISIDLQAYFNYRYDNAIPTDEVIIGINDVRPRRYVSDGEGYSTGIELMLKHDITRHFYGWIAYTLSWARQQREPNGDFDRFFFDQRHILTTVASYRFGRGWEAGLRFRFVTGRPDTPVESGIFDADGGFYRQIFGETASINRQAFHQLDLRLQKTWLFDLWRLSVYLDVQNVYNAKNPEATLYDYRYRESGPLRGLPVLPTLGIKGSF